MTDQQKQIEALADALTSERAVRCQEMALLEEKIDKLQRRIETLEGKERSAVYDPVSGKTVEAVTDTLSIRACKVMTEEDIKIQIEQAARSAADSFAEALGQVEKCLRKPGGLLEQFEKETAEAKDAAPQRYEILEPQSGEKVPAYIIGGRVVVPIDKASLLLNFNQVSL